MIDYSHEIFNAITENLHFSYPNITVTGEYVRFPTKFPTVTIDEIWNTPAHLDSCDKAKYANITYRVQVFSNKKSGRRSEARAIYAVIDETMQRLGLNARSYTTMPEIYSADIYAINATYGGVIDKNGVIYRN